MQNSHIQLLEQWHQTIASASSLADRQLSDMDIIQFQALLMDNGADVFRALKRGDMAIILATLVDLSYTALSAALLSAQPDEIQPAEVTWHNDGLIISIMRRVSESIAHCASGQAEDYAALYELCKKLVRDFLNADFDNAFQRLHQAKMQDRHFPVTRHIAPPDLSDYLFE